ncbi:LysR family transcriptional regulator [Curvivirga aplysinae]|uniref:LysR family transcriptional regulator n=1 Tax=Curvivirga aplysinae TaxID=2529852 RepID=UPI0012BC7C2D|nr:LysR family transcriptional regulator [Curvivirga aplysinae]MTI09821.1 LysR family transcriptional regulator [Curvivirga aplysinae]
MLNDIALFIHIVEQRSLAAAGKSLNLPPATVTRRLKKLEETLQCQLIHRSARNFALTAEGSSYYDAFSGLVKQIEETARHLNSEMHQVSGPLKVLAPTNISIGILQPMWSDFIKQYPEVHLNLQISNGLEDIVLSQVDIALRIGPQNDSALYQKKLGNIATILVASPGYLDRYASPDSLSELANHQIIVTDIFSKWVLTNTQLNRQEDYYPNAHLILNDIYLASQMVQDGHGIALLPITEVYKELNEGKLQRVLTDWQGPEREIFAIWPTGKLLNAKAKALRDFMSDYISTTPILQGKF